MSIIAYTGLPGSGKTLSVVEHVIVPALKAGRVVVTNVPMDAEAVARLKLPGMLDEFPLEVVMADPSKMFDFAPNGSVVVLDEVWRLFPAGVKANQVPAEFKSWLAEHRHKVDDQGNAMQIVFVTQDLAQIAAFARQLVEQTFRLTKMSHLGASKKYRIDIYNGPAVGPNPPQGKRLRYVIGTYNKKYFPLYRSHTQSESAQPGANEASVDRRFVVWRSLRWMVGAPAVLAFAVWSVVTFGSWFAERGLSAEAARGGAASGPAAEVPKETPRPIERPPPRDREDGSAFRVVGYVFGEGKGRAVIRAADGTLLYVNESECWQPGDALTYCAVAGVVATQLGSSRPSDAR